MQTNAQTVRRLRIREKRKTNKREKGRGTDGLYAA